MFVALLKTMRPKQWVKNGFIFAALFFDKKLTDIDALLVTIAGAIIFSLLASTIYIINDLKDIDEDRNHPKKKHRPLPSGQLSPRTATIVATLLPIILLPASYFLTTGFFVICLIYFLGNLAYSLRLKHTPLLDVLLLAGFYVLRVGAGVALIEVERFSPWLYLFTSFLALYLGIGKRRAELVQQNTNGGTTRRVLEGYTLPFLDQLLVMVTGLTIITYSLYTFSAPNLPDNHSAMLTIPFLIYGVFRYLYLVQVEQIGEAPEEVLFTDRPLQLSMVLWGLTILGVFYL